MDVPEILYTGKGKDRRIAITDELRAFLKAHQGETKVKLAQMLHVSRPTLDRLFSECNIARRMTKKEKADIRLAEQLRKEVEAAEVKDAKQKHQVKKRIIKRKAKEIIKQRTIIDRLADPVRAKDGTPLTYNGETLDTMSALDLSLINQAKENPGANISLRALKLGIELQEERQRDREQMAKVLPKLRTQAEREAQRQRQSFLDKGVWTDMAQSALDAYQSDYLAFLIADYRWQLEGAPIYNRTATAQAQINQQPSMAYQARKDAAKAVKEALQKLRSDVASYYKLVSADTDETSPIALMIEQMNNL